jgi:hypothetical protein
MKNIEDNLNYINEELNDAFEGYNVDFEIIAVDEENETCIVEFTLNHHNDDDYLGIFKY